MTQRRPNLDDALAEVRRQIEAVVRAEQIYDQLTGLGNALALSEALKTAIEDNAKLWCALIEVDYFKRVNDKFTYAVADSLLQAIAKRLGTFDDSIPETLAFRAHGDEFYLFGRRSDATSDSRIGERLDLVRREIAEIRLSTASGPMSCTVSIGWMSIDDAGDEEVLGERAILRMVEAATSAAKIRGRNQLVRYSPEVEKSQRRSFRDDCAACQATFTVEVPVESPHVGDLHCPNCGGTRPRPRIE